MGPTPAEVAAIVAAIATAWPKPPASVAPASVSMAWRFSGRWWAGAGLRGDRPWSRPIP